MSEVVLYLMLADDDFASQLTDDDFVSQLTCGPRGGGEFLVSEVPL